MEEDKSKQKIKFKEHRKKYTTPPVTKDRNNNVVSSSRTNEPCIKNHPKISQK